jgi:hypothetical protein
MKTPLHFLRTLLLGMALVSGGTVAALAQTYTVSLSTDALNANSASEPFSLDFQFVDGSGTGDANNTITLKNFNFSSGGSLSSPASLSGGASQSGGTFTITDSSSFNEVLTPFTAGTSPNSTLSFQLTTTNHAETGAGSSPDELTFYVLDSNDNDVPTSDAAASSLVTIDLGAPGGPSITTFNGTTPYAGLDVSVTETPEPSSVATFMLGLAATAAIAGFRGRKPVRASCAN